MAETKINRGIGYKIVDVIIYVFIGLLSLICIIPFFHVVSVSISGNEAVLSNKVWFLPHDITFQAYRTVLGDPSMMKSFGFTILITVLFTLLGLALTICAAYALSRQRMKGRSVINTIFVITMYFGAGMIPEYILMDTLNLLDTMAVLILPLAISAYNMIILRTSMQAIPASLEEAASLDGCGDFRILVQVMLPLVIPTLATLALFYAVGRWNSYADALYYIQSDNLKPLQLKLYNLVAAAADSSALEGDGGQTAQAEEVVKSATIMFATIPIIIVYPFLQKYFVSGAMVGAVKE
ncbi:MAG: carbohydrate ABC transporter permease [Clostridia bacterium]|nr:carbohydrate ABC transporter permease [Clostridia bacterium]